MLTDTQAKISLSNTHRILVFWTMMIAGFTVSMTMVSMAIMLPPIMEAFQIPTSTAQWLTSGASLVSGIMVPVAAYMIKRFSNRLFFFIATALFTIGSFLGSIAWSFPVLLTGRLIHAIGGGLLMPFSQIMIMSIYPRERHGTVMGYFTLGGLIGPVISPYIAGLVIDNLGWQFMFDIFLILSLSALVLGLIFMKNVTERFFESFSVLSIVFSSCGFFGLMFGLGNLSAYGLMHINTGGVILAGLVFLFIFVRLQLSMKNPLLDLRIFKYPMFRTALFIAITMYMAFMGGGTLLPIYAQSIRGFSATTYAQIILPGSILMAVISVFAGKLYDKHGPRFVSICGSLSLFLGNFLSILFSVNTSPFYIAAASFLPAAGIAIFMPIIVPMAIGNLDDKGRVDGSAVLGTVRLVVNGLVVTYTVLLFTIFSEMFEPIAGIRASYISATFFSVILFFITIFAIPKQKLN